MEKAHARRPNPLHARKRARRLAVQALYQWQLSGQSLKEIDAQFRDGQDMSRADVAYFQELLHGVPARLDEVDPEIERATEREPGLVDPVERAILRIGVYELRFRLEIPYRVVLNEAVTLAKTFGAAESHKFVNGALDQVARRLRRTVSR